jgi:hypothetical protein
MAWTYYIYSPLTPQQAREVEDQYAKDFATFLTEHPDIANSDEGTGMVFSGDEVPSPDAVEAVSGEFGLEVSENLAERLSACQSCIEIMNPFPPDASRLQVTTLLYLLEKTGDGIMDWGDYQLQLSDRALKRLGQFESFGPLVAAKKAQSPKTKVKKPEVGEDRATRIVELFHLAEESHDLAIDLKRLISRQPELSQRYMAHLFNHGPLGDVAAAAALGVALETLLPLLKELELRVEHLSEA